MTRIALSLSLGTVLLGGCTTVANERVDDPTADLDRQRFACAVEPVLARDCSYTGCHGNARFPLRVYSVGKLRAGSMDTLEARLAELTDAERLANFRSAAGFSFGGVSPGDNLLLRKALPAEDGGYEHLGGAIFTGPDDPRAVAIHDWLAGGTGCPGGGS